MIIKGMKDEGKEAECSFYPFTFFTFLPLNIMPNDKKAYAQREKAHIYLIEKIPLVYRVSAVCFLLFGLDSLMRSIRYSYSSGGNF